MASTKFSSLLVKLFLPLFHRPNLSKTKHENWFPVSLKFKTSGTWSFLKISRGTMKLSNARSSILDRSSSIALKMAMHTFADLFVVLCDLCLLTISVSPSP